MIALTELYPTLTNIVRNLERDDVATVEALLIDVTGDVDAGRMLHRLAMWWGKTRNSDGWVYKSYEDWWAELRIKEHKLPRTKGHLERVGVEIAVKKAEGNPTRHYRLDVKYFFQLLARSLKVSRKKLALLMQFPSESVRKMEIGNGQKTITTKPSPQSSPDVVVNTAILEAKKIKGISDHTAQRLVAQYGAAAVYQMAHYCLEKKYKGGALARALRDGWHCPPVEIPQSHMAEASTIADEQTTRAADVNPSPTPPLPDDPAKWEADKREAEPNDEETQEELTPEIVIFNRVMDQLRLQWGKQGAYLHGIRMAQADGSKWLLEGTGIGARLLADKRLQNNIAQLGRVLTGNQALTVAVV